ncbi:MAG TPA: hypothetical protein VFV41_08260 [Streptosporangiaceae bacterium]|nr:hypothetical protein [Streptosporangiaceae bacterium]
MDTEGAEIHFRRLAERALREVAAEPDVLARVASVERALTVTGAIDAHRAEAIKADLRIAVKAREPRRPSAPPGLGAVLRFPSRRQQFTATSSGVALPGSAELRRASPAASSPRAADRVFPVAAALPLGSGNLRGTLHLLAYLQDGAGARIWSAGRVAVRDQIGRAGRRGHAIARLDTLRATDDEGGAYLLHVGRMGSSNDVWLGEFYLDPDPPAGIRWLEIGDPAVRVDLTPPDPAPRVTVGPSSLAPGEHYLHRLASGWLVNGFAEDVGEVLDALRTAGALPGDSPVPGQLAALARALDGGPAEPGLPEQWRIATAATAPHDGYAGLGTRLPDLDGATITLLGIRASEDGDSALNLYATGVSADEPLPWLLWVRDACGWHAVSQWPRGGGADEAWVECQVVPPPTPGDWLEVLACGRSADVRVTVPVRWSGE